MKFSNIVLLTATVVMASQSRAQEGKAVTDTVNAPGVVILNNNNNNNTNSNAATGAAAAVSQPTTVVESTPAKDSKAESLRKARQDAEIQTEQKVVEKLEESRFKDEQNRAERLFGDKLETNEGGGVSTNANTNTNINVNNNSNSASATVVAPVIQTVQPTVAPVVAPVVAPTTPVVAPVVTTLPAPTLHVETIEVTAPKEERPVAPIATSILGIGKPGHLIRDEIRSYVSLGVGSSNYNASNVDSSYSMGVTVGKKVPGRFALEGIFNYSNHNIDTYWQGFLYRELDQYDGGVGVKYFFMDTVWKPYVGGQVIYSYRLYTDRNLEKCGFYGYCNPSLSEEVTHALNLGPSIGVNVAVSPSFQLGADFKYNFNFVNKRDINYAEYGVPTGTRPLEEISFYTFQITGLFLF